MKWLILGCLLAVSIGSHAYDLDPDCYKLYDQFLAADYINAGRIAVRMHDTQCWPALQGGLDYSGGEDLVTATDCASLSPHIVKMINDQAHVNGYSVLQIADAKEMTKDTRGKVTMSLILQRIDPLIHNPFAPKPLSGTTRVLDCSAEARFTNGSYLIQMYLDRDSDGQEFFGMVPLMDL